MLKGIIIRIYPTKEQVDFINQQLGCCRFVYNKCLDHRKSVYEKEQKTISSSESINYIVELKKDNPWLKDVHSKVLQQSVRDLNRAYDNFFKQHLGFPKFKSRKDNKQSCRFPNDAFIGIKGNRISLIKSLKDIHYKCSKKDEKYLNKHQDSVHSITLTKTKTNKYYLSLLVDYQPVIKKKVDNSIGLDLGIEDFMIDSNGVKYKNQHFYKDKELKIKHLNRKLSKQVNGSRNKEKTRIKLAKINEKIKNQRYNYIQQLTTQLVSENQTICVENLNTKGMMKNHRLSKSIQDVSWGEFINVLEYKCLINNRLLVKIDRFYPSSKTCNHCGYVKKDLKLSDRIWVCPDCGTVIDRDVNAANNILDEGIRIIGLSSPEFKLVDYPTVDDKVVIPLKSSDRVKQEKNVK